MESFATIEDYEARYGTVDDEGTLSVLLADASAFVAGFSGFRLREDDEAFMANLVRITCAVVHRSLMAGDFVGVTQYSETANDYTASVTPYNPSGDFYLTTPEKRVLGITRSRVAQIWPYARCDDAVS